MLRPIRSLLQSRRGLFAALAVAATCVASLSSFAGAQQTTTGDEPARAADTVTVGPQHSKAGGRLGREIEELRTSNSRTYEDEHGTRTARIFAGSVNFRASDDRWKAIDSRLEPEGAGYSNRRNRWDAALPGDLSSGAVRATRSGYWVSFRLLDAQAPAVVDGNVATYAAARPGLDVKYTTTSDSIKEELVLANADAPRSFSFDLDASTSLTPKLRPSGVVEFVDRDGDVQMTIAAPFAVDAAGAETRAVDFSLAEAGDGWRLTMSLRDNWLDDADRQWPVVVDPSLWPNKPDRDCSLHEGTPETSVCGADTLKAGYGGGYDHRALLHFDVSAVPADSEVLAAVMAVYARSLSTTNAKTLQARELSREWTSGASWKRYDGTSVWAAPGGDFESTSLATRTWGSGDAGTWGYFELDAVAPGWVKGTRPNRGVLLKDDGTRSVNQVISLNSSEHADTTKLPHIDLRYTHRLGERKGYKFEEFGLTDRLGLKVNAGTGNLLVNQTDLKLPGGLGPDLAIGRTYNSLNSETLAFGSGWGMDTAPDVRLEDHGGSWKYLYGPSGYKVRFSRNADGSYTGPEDLDATLSRNGDSSHTLTHHQSQSKLRFEATGSNQTARLEYLEDRNGRKIRFAYVTGTRKLSTITDARNKVTQFVYDSSGRIEQMTDPAGRAYSYGYTSGRLTTYTDPAGGVTQFEYAGGKMSQVTTPEGRVTKVAYHPSGHADAGKVSSVTQVKNTDGTGPVTRFAYVQRRDGSSDATVTDANNHDTKYVFDQKARVTQVTDALNRGRSSTYTSGSNVEEYFAASNTSSTASSKMNWDTDGNFLGNTADTGTGNLTSTVTGYGGQTGVTGGQYLPGSATNEQGRQETYGYDAGGNQTRTTRLKANGTTASEVRSVYDPAVPGKLDKIIDPKNNETAYEYDNDGNLEKIIPPLPLGATVLSYAGAAGADQALGRLTSKTDGAGRVESFEYDALDRVKKITYSDGSQIVNTWDGDGNLTQRVDTSGTWTYAHDKLGRLTAQTRPDGRNHSYGYDSVGSLTSLTNSGGTTEYAYDAANQLKAVHEAGVTTPVTYTRDDDGNRTKLQLPNGVVVDQTFNKANQVLTIDALKGSSKLLSFAYEYRTAANSPQALRSKVTDKRGHVTTYEYDELDRLLWATTKSGATVLREFGYTYDPASNIVSMSETGQPDVTYSHNAANQIVTRNGASYTYDQAGNETVGMWGRALTYNARSQTTSAAWGGGATPTSWTHAGAGQSELTQWGDLGFVNNVLGVGFEHWSGGARYYTHDAETKQLISQRIGATGTRQFFLLDALGSVRGLTNAAGDLALEKDYTPYGKPMTTDATGASLQNDGSYTRRGFVGGAHSGHGLMHFGERYLDVDNGRWTQPDPLDQTGDLREGNRYSYVGGNPTNFVDPSGMKLGRCNPYGETRDPDCDSGSSLGDVGERAYDTAKDTVRSAWRVAPRPIKRCVILGGVLGGATALSGKGPYAAGGVAAAGCVLGAYSGRFR